jgi:two-component system NtrC family response regulator
MRLLEQHAWPGNVRELANVVEHAAIWCEAGAIGPEHLPTRLSKGATTVPSGAPQTAVAGTTMAVKAPHFKLGGAAATLRELEMAAIHEALERHKGNKPKAAEELGISLKTLYNKLNQAGGLEQAG